MFDKRVKMMDWKKKGRNDCQVGMVMKRDEDEFE